MILQLAPFSLCKIISKMYFHLGVKCDRGDKFQSKGGFNEAVALQTKRVPLRSWSCDTAEIRSQLVLRRYKGSKEIKKASDDSGNNHINYFLYKIHTDKIKLSINSTCHSSSSHAAGGDALEPKTHWAATVLYIQELGHTFKFSISVQILAKKAFLPLILHIYWRESLAYRPQTASTELLSAGTPSRTVAAAKPVKTWSRRAQLYSQNPSGCSRRRRSRYSIDTETRCARGSALLLPSGPRLWACFPAALCCGCSGWDAGTCPCQAVFEGNGHEIRRGFCCTARRPTSR